VPPLKLRRHAESTEIFVEINSNRNWKVQSTEIFDKTKLNQLLEAVKKIYLRFYLKFFYKYYAALSPEYYEGEALPLLKKI
jgi:hypothetical protein